MLEFNNSGMRWQIQSAFHEQKHVADMAFARIPLEPVYKPRNGA